MPLSVPVNMRDKNPPLASKPINLVVKTKVGMMVLMIEVIDLPVVSMVETIARVVLIASSVHVTIEEHLLEEAFTRSLPIGIVKVIETTKLSEPTKTIKAADPPE